MLRKVVLFDDDIRPDLAEEVILCDQPAVSLYQDSECLESLGCQSHRLTVAIEQPLAGDQCERTEAI